jgi:hypothetical protein
MCSYKVFLISLLQFARPSFSRAQPAHMQQGLVFKTGTNLRLSGVNIVDKRTSASARSNLYGSFAIAVSPKDTVEITSDGYASAQFVVTDFADKIIFLEPVYSLPEVMIKENTIFTDLNSVKKGYRKKSVFYTGTPHYYYLALKPMTFIYENFKSEVINARKFNKFAKDEMAYYEIAARFTDEAIKTNVPIKDDELEHFKEDYWPIVEQIRDWNDYDLANYIIKSYQNFRKNRNADPVSN